MSYQIDTFRMVVSTSQYLQFCACNYHIGQGISCDYNICDVGDLAISSLLSDWQETLNGFGIES